MMTCVERITAIVKSKTSVLKSVLCDYSDAYILVKGTISITALAAVGGNGYKKVMFKKCAPFTHCINEINNYTIR